MKCADLSVVATIVSWRSSCNGWRPGSDSEAGFAGSSGGPRTQSPKQHGVRGELFEETSGGSHEPPALLYPSGHHHPGTPREDFFSQSFCAGYGQAHIRRWRVQTQLASAKDLHRVRSRPALVMVTSHHIVAQVQYRMTILSKELLGRSRKEAGSERFRCFTGVTKKKSVAAEVAAYEPSCRSSASALRLCRKICPTIPEL